MKNAAFFVISLARVSELDFSFIFNAFCLFEDLFFATFGFTPIPQGAIFNVEKNPVLAR